MLCPLLAFNLSLVARTMPRTVLCSTLTAPHTERSGMSPVSFEIYYKIRTLTLTSFLKCLHWDALLMWHSSIHVPHRSGGSAFLLPCILKITHLARAYIDISWTGSLLPSSFDDLQVWSWASKPRLSGLCNSRESETHCADTTEALQICSMAIRTAAIVLEALWGHCKLVRHWLILRSVLQGWDHWCLNASSPWPCWALQACLHQAKPFSVTVSDSTIICCNNCFA